MPTLRGTGIQTGNASSFTVPWPSGTVTNDTALIFVGATWPANTPSGWTLSDDQEGSNWMGTIISKILSSADITAGSAPITWVSTSSAQNAVIAIATIVGTCTVKEVASIRDGFGTSTKTVTTSSSILTTDSAVYFGSDSGATTDTINRGTQRQQTNVSTGSGCLYTEMDLSAVTPPISITASYGTSHPNYQAAVILATVVLSPSPTMQGPNVTLAKWTTGTGGGVSRRFVNPGLNGGMNG